MSECKEFNIAKNSVYEFIDENIPFSIKELKQYIIECGGVFRISIETSLHEFLINLEERNIIFYNHFNKTYDRMES